jgi:hypothetical protein
MSESSSLLKKSPTPSTKKKMDEKQELTKNYGTTDIEIGMTGISKGDRNSVMDDFEEEMKKGGPIPQITVDLVFVKSLRKSIETSTNNLETSANRLLKEDWVIFFLIAVCMGIVSIGIDIVIYHGFTLNQILGVCCLALKGLEKSMSLSKTAIQKQEQAKQLKELVRRISSIELALYNISPNTEEGKVLRLKLSDNVSDIWKEFNKIELNSYLPPPRQSPEANIQ